MHYRTMKNKDKSIKKNKDGSVSYQFYYSGINPKTRKPKLYQKTFRLEAEYVGKKKYTENFLIDCQKQFKDEIKKLSSGVIVKKENIRFIDFAREHVENIIKNHPDRYNHYVAMKGHLPILEERLGYYYIHDINQDVTQAFCEWLNERTYEKVTVTVIDSLCPLMKQRKITITQTTKDTGLADITINNATKVGQTVSEDTATKLCDYLKVSISNYFDIQKKIVSYSKNSKINIRALVSVVLTKAVKRRLIERNYMTDEFVDNITGTERKKEIYEGNEIREFMKGIAAEKDIRKKVAFSIFIYLGLRLGEVAGLEFKDINFNTNEIAINRSSSYTSEFGIKTKKPKTKASRAVLSVPQGLMDLLAEYKVYWDKQKALHGDLWECTDRLFCQSNGYDMAGSTIRNWLYDFEHRNNLKHVTPHGLRHTFITMLIDNDIDVKTASTMARHEKVQTTLDTYTHRTSKRSRAATNIVDKVLSI